MTKFRKVFNGTLLGRMMQINLLKNIVTSIAGSSASGVVDLLYNKKNVNEFLISKKLKSTINQTRNILYRLADEGLVSFIRKKDVKKGGWYTFYWTLNSGKSLLKFKEKLQQNIETLEQQLAQRRTGRFFVCKNCDIEFNEESSLTHNYTCPECGQVLDVKDLSAEMSQIEKDVTRLKSLLATVQEEVQIISGKETKARERKLHAEAKKKQVERAAQKKARAKSAASLVKKPTPAKKPKQLSAKKKNRK